MTVAKDDTDTALFNNSQSIASELLIVRVILQL